jgi:hypothetical protein
MAFERRGVHHFSFKMPRLDSLLIMERKLTAASRLEFEADYGQILNLLHVEVDTVALTTLAQFFDSPLRCFTFQDFQLLPTLEEFERILGLSIEGRACYLREVPTEEEVAKALYLEQKEIPSLQGSGGMRGFSRATLEAKAQEELSKGHVKAYNAILALLIYGSVMFPSSDRLISMSAVGVFLTKNPVPTLLADLLYSLHDRRSARKGGRVLCCVPLFMAWFRWHMPKEGPFVEDKAVDWSKSLSSLKAEKVCWYSRQLDSPKMLLQCEGFPNVPLVGIQGSINYNPILATRQLGYAMEGEPEGALLTEFILGSEDTNQELWSKIKRAWLKIDKTLMGRKNCLAKEAYTRWVKDRVLKIQMPFTITTPATSPPSEPEPPITVSQGEVEALKIQIAQLKKKNEEWQLKDFRSQGDIMILKRERDEKDEEIQECKKKVKEAQGREEKFKDGLASSDMSIMALKKQIKDLERSLNQRP